jgi:NRAMP (natural resistance-associated macrophage protein)-like metal ion transporter
MAKDNRPISLGVPAELIEKTISAADGFVERIDNDPTVKRTKAYWQTLGPGLTTGASDDDPSGIGTYSQTGAQYGFQLLWLSAFTFPLMAVVQEMCARIGLVTGRGLAGAIRVHYSRRMIYLIAVLLLGANTFNIGADLGAMAQATQLLWPQAPYIFLVPAFGIASALLQILTPYARYAKYLKWLALVLFAYIASAILAHLDWTKVLRYAIIPSLTFDKSQLLLLCAILGTTISPYLFFWQTSQEVEEAILEGKTSIAKREGTTKKAIHAMRIDVWSGMFLSNLTMFFIIAACAAVLFTHGVTNIATSAQAAEALRPFAGNAIYILFAVGIIGTGLLAIPVLAGSSSYAISEAVGWREGLYRDFKHAKAFYMVIILAMAIGVAFNFIGLDPIKALIYAAVINGVAAPFILIFIVLLSSNKQVMGEWTNKPLTTIVGWGITGILGVAGAAAIVSLL